MNSAGGAPPAGHRPKIIAVIMTYNCARLLPKAYKQIPQQLVDEVIVTDDGSKDAIEPVAAELGIQLYRHVPNRGYGGNLKEGLRRALEHGAEYIVEIHGDGQFHPDALRYAMPYIEDGRDFIIGSRFQNPQRALELGMPLLRFMANRGLSFIDRLILRLPFTEFHTGFRIYSRQLLNMVPWQKNSDGYLFSFQIIAQAAYSHATVAEVPVEADYRGDHTSHSIRGASLYAVQTFGVLFQYLLAHWQIRHCSIFPPRKR